MNKLEPLKQFICDECGEIIEKPSDGCVEWLDYNDDESDNYCRVVYNFRIVHHIGASPNRSCYFTDLHNHYEGTESSAHLHDFVNDIAIAKTMGMLQDFNEGHLKFKNKEAFKQFLDLVRRCTIPFYEEGRIYLYEHYLDYTGDSNIDFDRLDSKSMKGFLDWIHKNNLEKQNIL